MLSFFADNWEHRAYWGANTINYGTDGTASRKSMGALPAKGEWVRLEVSAAHEHVCFRDNCFVEDRSVVNGSGYLLCLPRQTEGDVPLRARTMHAGEFRECSRLHIPRITVGSL